MKRGELWVGSGPGFAGKPRPVLVVQADSAPEFQSEVICLVTSADSAFYDNRVRIEPNAENGLERTSWIMTDKIYSFGREHFAKRIGRLSEEEMGEVSAQLRRILGL